MPTIIRFGIYFVVGLYVIGTLVSAFLVTPRYAGRSRRHGG
jgi:hypothetical protein